MDLLKLNVMDRDVQKPDVDLGFGMKHEIIIFKSINKITDTQIQNFKKGAKKFLSKMIGHLLMNSPYRSPFARWVYEPEVHGGLPGSM